MIAQLLEDLEKSNKVHLYEGKAVLEAFGGAMYPFDLLTIAVLNRSMSLTSGFVTLMRLDNFVSAVPLIRLQLDNYLRFAAGWLVSDLHEFAIKVLTGVHIKELKTRNGKKMTDGFLVKEFSKEHKWIERVYKNTSGYIHLSEKHMLINVVELDTAERSEVIKISDKDDHVPEHLKAEAIMAFAEITKLVLHRVYSWRYTKDNPPGMKDARKDQCASSL